MKNGASGHVPELCSQFHQASELIGRRWSGAIIFILLKSRCRFAVLRDAIPDITDRMLSERLHELEQHGIITRTVIPETPVRVEYELTKKGRTLAPVFDAIAEWAQKWVSPKDSAEDEPPEAGRAGDRKRTASSRPRRPARSRSTA